MNNKEFIRNFEQYLDKDEDYMINIIYDELAEYCMEYNIEDVTEEQLVEIARIIIENGFDEDNF